MGPSAADYRIPLFMDIMKDMGAIKEKVFGFYLTSNMYTEEPEGSILTIGGYNLTKYAQANQTVRWHKLINSDYWSISLPSVKLRFKNGQVLNF